MKYIVASLFMLSTISVNAAWVDDASTATLPKNAAYCGTQRALVKFSGFVLDQNPQGAMKMISAGECSTASGPLRINIIQRDRSAGYINFMTPSGKTGYTLDGYID